MNKVELLQEKYNAKKNDMSKEELLKFNERLLKSFLSDKKFNDGVFWAYSEITDRVIEDLKEKNKKLLSDTNFELIKMLELNVNHYKNKSLLAPKESEVNEIRTENERLEKDLDEAEEYISQLEKRLSSREQRIIGLKGDLQEVWSRSNQLSYQAESHERDVLFFRQCIKEQRDIVIDEVVKLLDKEIMYYKFFQTRTARELIKDLKTKIKEMGKK